MKMLTTKFRREVHEQRENLVKEIENIYKVLMRIYRAEEYNN